jgi:hypothetical protein
MKRLVFLLSCAALLYAAAGAFGEAQAAGWREGSYELAGNGDAKGEIIITALRGRRARFSLAYTRCVRRCGTDDANIHIGQAEGSLLLRGREAVFVAANAQELRTQPRRDICTLRFTVRAAGTLSVRQSGECHGTDAGFGENIDVSGTYRLPEKKAGATRQSPSPGADCRLTGCRATRPP